MKLKYSSIHGCVNSLNKCTQSCAHDVEITKCTKCKGKQRQNGTARWLLDLGASLHFTCSMDDFIKYEVIKMPILVKTASQPIHIKGKGTVLIQHKVTHNGHTGQHVTCLYPMFYIPEITGRILSIGEFLQQGLHIYGDVQSMVLHRTASSLPLIQCVPTFPGHTIYWLDLHITDMSVSPTVYTVDYTLMHKCFGHPSKDVLCHTKNQTKCFP